MRVHVRNQHRQRVHTSTPFSYLIHRQKAVGHKICKDTHQQDRNGKEMKITPTLKRKQNKINGHTCSPLTLWNAYIVNVQLSPFLTGRMFVRQTYFGHFDEL